MLLMELMEACGEEMAEHHKNLLVVGFTAQGNFYGHPYKRKCYDSKFDWVFEGIKDE